MASANAPEQAQGFALSVQASTANHSSPQVPVSKMRLRPYMIVVPYFLSVKQFVLPQQEQLDLSGLAS